RITAGLLFGDGTSQFCVSGVTGLDCDNVAANATANQSEVANNIEDFVPNEFVWKTQRFLAENGIPAQDDGVFQATALDQVLLHQRLDILVINKRPGRGDLAVKNGRGE